jgi:hypothetical protein
MATWPVRGDPLLAAAAPAQAVQADQAAARSGFKPLSAADLFRCQVPPGWEAIPDHPFGLSAEEKKVFGITLHGPWRGEIPVKISAAYYAEGNLLYKSVDHFIRVFSQPSLGAAPETSAQGRIARITVSGKPAMMFERTRNEFVPMHPHIGPKDLPPRDDPRVYERRGEMMAQAIPVRERFVVIPGKTGFHALRYSAHAKDFQEFLADFEKVTATFDTLE